TAWAETMSLFEAAQRDKYVLLADIGYMSTTVSQARGDGLTSIASFSLGGAHISGDIAEVLSIPFKTAEDIKEKVDLNLQFSSGEMYEAADKTKVAADITNEIVKARLEQMAEFLKRAIDKSELKCPSYVPLYLTGLGVSYIRGAKEFLAEKTGKNIEIVAPVAPGYNRPCRSSLISLLDVASNLDESKPKAEFFKDKLKRLLFGS
ncbi:MAG TPA: cell division protein FtsA, partial [Eubacteriales bacterium]|nr:cell division protein FtsA [Eubacteriales bacterium]